jgi:hypothetical protein
MEKMVLMAILGEMARTVPQQYSKLMLWQTTGLNRRIRKFELVAEAATL